MGHLFVLSSARERRFVLVSVVSVVEVCVDYGGVYVVHACINLCVVWGCVVESFHEYACIVM